MQSWAVWDSIANLVVRRQPSPRLLKRDIAPADAPWLFPVSALLVAPVSRRPFQLASPWQEAAMDAVWDGASEGDVETQIVVPLLTRGEFLAIDLRDIRSKEGISARDIGKGTKRKIGYVPDFCAYQHSLPVLVIEAKSPAADVRQAYAEARLYAAEINRSFISGLNPCCRLISSRIEYLAAIMPTTAIDDDKLGTQVYDLMETENRIGHPSYQRYIALVEQLEPYLQRQHRRLLMHPGYADLKESGALYLLAKVREALSFARREASRETGQLDPLDG